MSLTLKLGQTHRFTLVFQGAAPTGYPQIEINQGANSVLIPTNMIEVSGTSQKRWYKDVTIANDAELKTHTVTYEAIVRSVTKYFDENYDVEEFDNDDLAAAIDAISIGAGAYEITVRILDQAANRVPDAVVTAHNALNEDPLIAKGATDNQGEITFNLNSDTYYIRVKKAGFNFAAQDITTSGSATFSLSGSIISYSEPAEADLCRLFFYPIHLDGTDVTNMSTKIFSADDFAKTADGMFIRNIAMPFIYNDATTPDSYYFDAIQGSKVHITSKDTGLDMNITVPLTANANLDTLIPSD